MELIGKHASNQVLVYFIAAIVLGSILLSLPIAATTQNIAYIDALFTATSAVCVTGLIVLDTPNDFTLFGQIVILVLIQLGGLGMMTFASALVLSLGSRLSIRSRHGLTSTIGSTPAVTTGSLIRSIILTTVLFEGIGAAILFFGFRQTAGTSEALYHAIFQSVSAFCNAGFSTFSDSLEGFQSEPLVLLPIAGLIVAGGLGFVVIHELANKVREPQLRLSLHSKLCLVSSVLLIVVGGIAFFVSEYGNSLGEMSQPVKVMNALFQSITTRTAGFNSIPQISLTEFSILMTILFMFIGGCPGSTAGGVKTTTVAIIGILGWRRLTGYRSLTAFRSAIKEDSASRALAILVTGGVVVVAAFAAFIVAEGRSLSHEVARGNFVESLFEVVSAFGTVGLSMGKTGMLDGAGKVIVILLMFTGRVGLLTLVLALARPTRVGEITYLDEDIMVG